MSQKSTQSKYRWYKPFDGNGTHQYHFDDGSHVRIGAARSMVDDFIKKGVAYSLHSLTANVIRAYCEAHEIGYTETVEEIGSTSCTTITRVYDDADSLPIE
ncbi:MAG: hypothetical protein RR280_01105 [Bacteroidaceae bacterium]